MTLEEALIEFSIPYRKLRHRPRFTSPELAEEIHISGYQIAKPVVVKTPFSFAMCVLTACDQLELSRVAELLGEPEVELATENDMRQLFPDCEIGAEPPVGRLFGMPTIVDERLHRDDQIVMQAGTHRDTIQIRRLDWEQLCTPTVARIARD